MNKYEPIEKYDGVLSALQAQMDDLDGGGDPPDGMTAEAYRLHLQGHMDRTRAIREEALAAGGGA